MLFPVIRLEPVKITHDIVHLIIQYCKGLLYLLCELVHFGLDDKLVIRLHDLEDVTNVLHWYLSCSLQRSQVVDIGS